MIAEVIHILGLDKDAKGNGMFQIANDRLMLAMLQHNMRAEVVVIFISSPADGGAGRLRCMCVARTPRAREARAGGPLLSRRGAEGAVTRPSVSDVSYSPSRAQRDGEASRRRRR